MTEPPDPLRPTDERAVALAGGRSFLFGGVMSHRSFGPIVGLLSSIPVVTAAVRAARSGWQPVGDDAVIALRSFDVLTARSPQLGQASTSGAHSPGPMLYWLFSLPARLGPSWLPAAVAGLVAVACFIGIVTVVHRRVGPGLAVLAGLGLTLTARAVDPFYLASVWNPVATLAPFVLLLFVAWSVAAGSRRLFPLAVVLASFCVQTHLTYLVPSLAVLGVATVCCFGLPLWSVGRKRSIGAGRDLPDSSVSTTTSGRHVGPAGWFGAGVVAGLVCWALPVWEQVTGNPGNVTVLSRPGDSLGPGLGLRAGLYALVQAVGVTPRFAGPSHTFDPMKPFEAWSSLGTPSPVQEATAAAVVLALAVLAVRAVRRADRVAALGLLLAATVGASMVLTTATVPGDDARMLTVSYTLLWLVPAGLFIWLAVLAALVRDVAARRATTGTEREARSSSIGSRVAIVGVGFVLAVTVVTGVFIGGEDPFQWTYRPATALGDAAAERVEPGQRYLVEADPSVQRYFLTAVAYRVRRAGGEPVLARPGGDLLGPDYQLDGERCAGVLRLVDAARTDPPSAQDEVLVRVSLGAPSPSSPSEAELRRSPLRVDQAC